jgi:hypothetical protein
MNRISNKYNLGKLKLIERKLKLKNYQRIYEASKKPDKKKFDYDLINVNEFGRNLLSDIPDDLVEYVSDIEGFCKDIFDIKKQTISIENYFELLTVIKYLINVMEFDLCEAFVVDSLVYDPTRLENILDGGKYLNSIRS